MLALYSMNLRRIGLKNRTISPLKICRLIPLYILYIHMNTYGDYFEYD
jgi:hypothetical protein